MARYILECWAQSANPAKGNRCSEFTFEMTRHIYESWSRSSFTSSSDRTGALLVAVARAMRRANPDRTAFASTTVSIETDSDILRLMKIFFAAGMERNNANVGIQKVLVAMAVLRVMNDPRSDDGRDFVEFLGRNERARKCFGEMDGAAKRERCPTCSSRCRTTLPQPSFNYMSVSKKAQTKIYCRTNQAKAPSYLERFDSTPCIHPLALIFLPEAHQLVRVQLLLHHDSRTNHDVFLFGSFLNVAKASPSPTHVSNMWLACKGLEAQLIGAQANDIIFDCVAKNEVDTVM
ncbi:hypothetical protein K504DRAFT_447192 [Pleomassaria siparia CBS 279.74]|uniref:Uncharacterized protein n=1 Tax=Pleomassaria siparia CBS 279.74 TaxID=1314801 RepID=A0A6G1K2S9_9PLEO|nr:hypothetical protein K504DRAFT_447192 [Pleomassaria siparia CBS 279.74]